jgi:hypothetical protein
MGMCAKAGASRDTIFVDNPKGSKVLVLVILIPELELISKVLNTKERNVSYIANENVWKVLSQPWSAWPRSSLFLGIMTVFADISLVKFLKVDGIACDLL